MNNHPKAKNMIICGVDKGGKPNGLFAIPHDGTIVLQLVYDINHDNPEDRALDAFEFLKSITPFLGEGRNERSL